MDDNNIKTQNESDFTEITYKNNVLKGTLFALIAGILWGLSGICAQFLFQQKNLTPEWVVCIRLISSGIILLTIAYIKEKNDIFEVFKSKKHIKDLVLFGILGMFGVQYTYFVAINYSNAATATVIQYLGPAIILIYQSLRNKSLPSFVELFAVILSIIGVFILVTHMDINNLVISKQALFWALGAAFALAYYSIKPGNLLNNFSNICVTGWGMLIGGIAFSFIKPIFDISGIFDIYTIGVIIIVIIFGTVIPFSIYVISTKLIGPTKTSLFSTIEPVSSAVFSIFLLNLSFGFMDFLGTAMIISMVVILSVGKKEKKES
ncbi:MAG: EamA family transporter [Intestinibacter bartlettii]|uniref:DMT family transporter n=1 Tax=Intestinibacter bartlettii TaxID=261299 RepID=UPI0026F0D358|nr:EamA family transporter [Intestinibacter bartlettii]MDO5009595.1 EamA family transporter [Intestinibacter bartlettii]